MKMLTVNVNVCKSCGFQSVLFPEIPWEEAKKLPYKPPNFTPSQIPIMPEQRYTIKNRKPLVIFGFILVLIIIFILLFG